MEKMTKCGALYKPWCGGQDQGQRDDSQGKDGQLGIETIWNYGTWLRFQVPNLGSGGEQQGPKESEMDTDTVPSPRKSRNVMLTICIMDGRRGQEGDKEEREGNMEISLKFI